MRKLLIIMMIVGVSLPVWADSASKQARAEKRAALEAARQEKAEDKGIFYTNGRMDYVKLERMTEKELKERSPQHPATISVDQMKSYLLAIMASERDLLKKAPEVIQVFSEKSVGFLAPIMAKAFAKVQPDQMVAVSWLVKSPNIVLREDRIVAVECWVKDNQLYMQFNKLLAKLVGDTDKKGNFNYVINNAKSLRTQLVSSGPITVTGKKDNVAMIAMDGDFASLNAPDAVAGSNVDPKARAQRSVKDRLTDLEQLRKDKMITEAEYQAKRKALLDNL